MRRNEDRFLLRHDDAVLDPNEYNRMRWLLGIFTIYQGISPPAKLQIFDILLALAIPYRKGCGDFFPNEQEVE